MCLSTQNNFGKKYMTTVLINLTNLTIFWKPLTITFFFKLLPKYCAITLFENSCSIGYRNLKFDSLSFIEKST